MLLANFLIFLFVLCPAIAYFGQIITKQYQLDMIDFLFYLYLYSKNCHPLNKGCNTCYTYITQVCHP